MAERTAAELPARRAGRARRRLLRALWVVAAFLLLLVLLRAFVGDVYPVSTGSMRPTIQAGPRVPDGPAETEWVLVTYDRSPPARYELVVLRPPGGEGEPLVKRVLGLPGENVRLVGGDFLVDGHELPPDANRPGPIPVFDDAHQDLRRWFQVPLADAGGPWSSEGRGWRLDARALAPESPAARAGLMLYHKELRDGFLERDGTHVRGARSVNDGVVACDVRVDPGDVEAGGRLTWVLTEEGDRFVAELLLAAEGDARARILRGTVDPQTAGDGEHAPAEGPAVLAEGPVSFAPGRWHAVSFANVDDRLTLTVDGATALETSYAGNRPLERPGVADRSVPPRVALGGAGLVAHFRHIRVLRDLYWVPKGRFAVDRQLPLGPDEIFVLGDNSGASTDSREFGPVHLEDVLGRAKAVVWPPSHARGF